MNRRGHLSLLLGGLPTLGGSLAGCRFGTGSARAANPDESIIIVGAGAAGLGAAESLREGGHRKITILEARERVGGRVWTSRAWGDAPMDMGASWIHGTRGNPITRLAREAGVETRATDYDDMTLFGRDGAPLGEAEQRELTRLGAKLYRVINSRPRKGAKTLRDSVDAAFAGRPARERALVDHLLSAMVEGDLAEDADRLAPDAYLFGESFGGGDVLFPGGYGAVFAPRFEKFDILTGHVVKAIQLEAAGVTVVTDRGDFRADRVVVTLPLGVLQRGSVRFDPALPEAKRSAIAALGMGCLNKLYLRFPEPFWQNDVQGFGYLGPEAGQWGAWLNMSYHIEPPILVAFNSGSFAREIEGWSDRAIVDDAMRVLRRIHGRKIPDPEGFQITRWASDPYAFGSYSTLRPGAGKATAEALAEPVGRRIFFAGEATSSDYPSTVHGAYLSGLREAGRVMSTA